MDDADDALRGRPLLVRRTQPLPRRCRGRQRGGCPRRQRARICSHIRLDPRPARRLASRDRLVVARLVVARLGFGFIGEELRFRVDLPLPAGVVDAVRCPLAGEVGDVLTGVGVVHPGGCFVRLEVPEGDEGVVTLRDAGGDQCVDALRVEVRFDEAFEVAAVSVAGEVGVAVVVDEGLRLGGRPAGGVEFAGVGGGPGAVVAEVLR